MEHHKNAMSSVMKMNDSLGMSKEVDILLPDGKNTQLRRGRRETVAGATAYDDAHDVFMTLSPYTSAREGEVSQLGTGPDPAGWAFELGNALMNCRN
jgi:hypothetical protein